MNILYIKKWIFNYDAYNFFLYTVFVSWIIDWSLDLVTWLSIDLQIESGIIFFLLLLLKSRYDNFDNATMTSNLLWNG